MHLPNIYRFKFSSLKSKIIDQNLDVFSIPFWLSSTINLVDLNWMKTSKYISGDTVSAVNKLRKQCEKFVFKLNATIKEWEKRRKQRKKQKSKEKKNWKWTHGIEEVLEAIESCNHVSNALLLLCSIRLFRCLHFLVTFNSECSKCIRKSRRE